MSGSSTKGRKLPPLLPLEYCRLDRAARMLECEVEDLLHWGATGGVTLHYLAKGIKADTAFNYDQIAYMRTKEGFNPEHGFRSDITDSHTLWVVFSQVQEMGNNICEAIDLLTRVDGYPEPIIFASVRLYGLFDVNEQSLEELYLQGSVESLFLFLYKPECEADFLFSIESSIKPYQLFIKKIELEKVYQAITTGRPLSQNIVKMPSTETMQRISNAKAAAERNSAPRAELVLSLLELVLGEDSSLIDNPYALYQRVNKQLREAKIIEPEITEQAFADILSKAKSARKDRLKNPS